MARNNHFGGFGGGANMQQLMGFSSFGSTKVVVTSGAYV